MKDVTTTKDKKTGLVLSGGGSRGIAHLGAIKALQENGYTFHEISGSSAGALVGALIAGGYSPDFILETLLSIDLKKFVRFSITRLGLFSIEKVADILHKYLPHNSFEHLKIPLYVCAADIEAGTEIFYSKGELIPPVLASCAIPGVFKPIKFDNRTLVDGGIINNLPLEPLQNNCDFIIGINVTAVDKTLKVSNAKDVLLKSLYLSISQQTSRKLAACDIAIEPSRLSRYDPISTKKANEIFTIGYDSARKALDAYRNLPAKSDDLA